MIEDFITEFQRYKTLGRKALDQTGDEALNQVRGTDNNSIAMIVRHISGNLISRFTEFLTSDGEKPWRNRDSEFEETNYSRTQVDEMWDRGWSVLERELNALTDGDLSKEITIRGHTLTVHEALARSVTHTAYHIGQIVMLAKIASPGPWQSLSMPKK
jgi:uncharacterized damage-inducible protein DinB